MKEIIHLIQAEENLNKAFKQFEKDNFVYFTSWQVLCVYILQQAMNDEAGWISYWMYELDFGKKATKNSVTKNNKPIPIKTLDNLYDCIVKQ